MRYARNGDVALAYQVIGDGPQDVLLVSGFLSNIEYAWMYPSLARFLTRLSGFSRLIMMDRRGSGLSDRMSEQPTIETSISDLEAVLDEVGSPRTTLFGLWDGCLTAIIFAATHPDRVASLVLFGSSPAQTPRDDYPWAWSEEHWADWLASIREGWGTRAWVVRNARWMGPSMLDDPDELEHWITYIRFSAGPSSAESVMRQDKDTDVRRVLPVVQAPTLVLHRTGDQVEEINAGRYVASKIPGARFVELAGVDGIPWLGDAGSGAGRGRAVRRRSRREPSDARTGASRQCSSPTSSGRPSTLSRWATRHGSGGWRSTTRSSDATSTGGRAGSSAPQATACWRCSTGRPPP